jgi:PPP family 3-phenylpropionic acid transporter
MKTGPATENSTAAPPGTPVAGTPLPGTVTTARLAYVALFVAVGASAPFLPVYYDSLGVDVRVIPLLGALMAGAGLFGSPLWGAAADRFPHSRFILPAAAVVAGIAAAAMWVVGWPALVVFVVALGLGMSGIGPILDARAVEAFGPDRARYGRLRMWGSASFVVASIGVGAVVERTSPSSLFVIYVPALVATAAIGLALRPRAKAHVAVPLRRFAAIGSVVRNPVLGPFLLAVLISWAASYAINSYFSIYLEQIGAPATLIGIAWAVGACVEVPLMLLFPLLSRRFGIERLILVGALALVARAVLVTTLKDPLLLTATMSLHGVAFALLTVGGVAYVAGHTARGTAATAQGVLTATSYSLATVIGPTAAGIAASFVTLPAVFALAGVVSVVGAAVLARVLLRRPDRSQQAVTAPSDAGASPGASVLSSAGSEGGEPGPGTMPGV